MTALGALLLVLPTVAGAPATQEEDSRRAFSFPLTRHARDQAQLAADHLDAQRWRKAIEVLQAMLVDQENAVLPDAYRATAHLVSSHPAHPGASDWARARLFELPREGRELYRTRYGQIAETALAEARGRRDRRALISVADGWPLTDAAIRAWWILGDLEMEEGHPRPALEAWSRAERAQAIVGTEPPPGAAARRALGLSLLDLELEEGEEPTLPSPGDPSRLRGPLPSRDADPWMTGLDLTPFDPTVSQRQYYYSLFPVLAGDRVLVSSTLELFCLEAYTGELLWRSGRPDGWDQLGDRKASALFEGLNRQEILVSPAVGGRVAVAALQLPYSDFENEDYQGIEVMSSIPQRRLYAYDLATGEKLWDHAPELVFDDASGTFKRTGESDFPQRMRVAAPPVVAGSRVLVPCYVLEGRMDYHVACYELATGELLWSTGIISGQRSRNMFGRALEEFCSTPVVVAGDRVVVQTELGTVAALDLVTGSILWESLYRQIALPKTAGYQMMTRRRSWRLAPPAVLGGVVVSTPADSDEITCFDLADGRVLWDYPQEMLSRQGGGQRGEQFDLLLGIGRDAIYLGGGRVAKLTMPGGLAGGGSLRLEWQAQLDASFPHERAPRPLLCRDHVLVPLPDHRAVLDRRDGRLQRTLVGTWEFQQYGNPLVADGQLFTLGASNVSGFFDWALLIERQEKRLAGSPGDEVLAIDTATLYSRRAAAALDDGQLFAALEFLKQGSAILSPLVGSLESENKRDGNYPRAADELHTLLRREALVLEEQGHRAGALAALARAEPLARTAEALRDTLLQIERNLRGPTANPRHLEVLARLDTTSGTLPLPVEGALGSPFPIVVDAEHELTPTVGLWVLLMRAETHADAGRIEEALEDWHRVLAEYGETRLEENLETSEFVIARIGTELEGPLGRAAYASFEARAVELYARALEEESVIRLERVSQLYPHSRAAVDADAARLDWAFESNDAVAVAAIVYGPTRDAQAPESRPALLRLARVLGRLGNEELERVLIAELAAETPDAVSDLPADEGRTFAELSAELEHTRSTRTVRLPRFDADVEYSQVEIGSYEYVGRFLSPDEAEGDAEELQIYLVRSEQSSSRRPGTGNDRVRTIVSFSSTDRTRPARSRLLDDPVLGTETAVTSETRLLVGGEYTLQAFDQRLEPVWRQATLGPIVSVEEHDGVVVVLTGTPSPDRAHAFDSHSGVPLWSLEFDPRGAWRAPVFGGGRVVFFSKAYGHKTTARVVDLFRGRVVTEVDAGNVLEARVEDTAWVQAGRLLVPNFTRVGPRRHEVVAYDLATGDELWVCPVPENEEFQYVARHADGTYLITASDAPGESGGVYTLDVEFGSLRRIVPLRDGEAPMGLTRRTVTELPTPDLFTYSTTGSRMVVRALYLPFQARWTWTLSVRDLDARRLLPLPAVSEDTVALAYVERNPNSGLRGHARLVFMDRMTGKKLHESFLVEEFGMADRLELRGLGDALFLIGSGGRSRGWRMQVLEKIR